MLIHVNQMGLGSQSMEILIYSSHTEYMFTAHHL